MINTIVSSMPLNYLQPIPMDKTQKCKKIIEKRLKIFYTDLAIIDGIKIRDVGVANYLYSKFYDQISFMVKSNSGNKMDAEDVFQEALIVIYQKLSKESLRLMSSFYTYLYSICWHLWLQKLNKRAFKYQHKGASDLDAWEDEMKMKEILEESEKYKLFQEHFLRLNLAGQKVLKLYMSNTSNKDIAKLMGYKSDNYAKFRKYIIKEKLRKSIMNDPQFKNFSLS